MKRKIAGEHEMGLGLLLEANAERASKRVDTERSDEEQKKSAASNSSRDENQGLQKSGSIQAAVLDDV